MRNILVLVALMILVLPISAMPTDMMNNTDVCKIGFDTGSSMMGVFAWHNLSSHQWEVVVGMVTYKGVHTSDVFYGDDTSTVEVT